jgi:hypothetical protein
MQAPTGKAPQTTPWPSNGTERLHQAAPPVTGDAARTSYNVPSNAGISSRSS